MQLSVCLVGRVSHIYKTVNLWIKSRQYNSALGFERNAVFIAASFQKAVNCSWEEPIAKLTINYHEALSLKGSKLVAMKVQPYVHRPALQSKIVIQYFESPCALNVFMNARSKRSKRIKRETSTHHNVISIWSIMAFSLPTCEYETIRRPLSCRSTLEQTTTCRYKFQLPLCIRWYETNH